MRKIQDRDRWYAFFRPYVDWMFRRSYRRFEYIGKENIPTDGAVIFAPNHTNALCDAMAILGIDHGQKVFVARADIFKDPKKGTGQAAGSDGEPLTAVDILNIRVIGNRKSEDG